jgi:hypothetical protein
MSQDFYVTVETERVAEVSAVGIQGLSGAAVNLEDIPNVDASSLENGSVLVYKTATSKWTSTKILDLQTVEAGEF